jgi:hypothetical protein
MAHGAISSRQMPRQPNKPKKGEPYRMHIILPSELVELIDRFAEQTGESDYFSSPRSRTEAIKILLVDGLKKRGLLE